MLGATKNGLGRTLLVSFCLVAGTIGCSKHTADSVREVTDAGGRTDARVLDCSQSLTDADQRAHAILAVADTTCTADADCVFSDTIPCGTTCFQEPVSKSGAADIAPALAELASAVCDPISAAGCVVPPLACPARGTPRCLAGICLSQGLPGCDSCITEIPPPSCGKRTQQMTMLISEYVGKADIACSVDTDCTGVRLTSDCFYDCPVPVSTSSAPELERALHGIEQSFCPPYLADGCEVYTTMIGCFLREGPDGGIHSTKCSSNRCQAVPNF